MLTGRREGKELAHRQLLPSPDARSSSEAAPYIVISFISFLVLMAVVLFLFRILFKERPRLHGGAVLYIFTSTAIGLLVSTFTRTQIAALVGPSSSHSFLSSSPARSPR